MAWNALQYILAKFASTGLRCGRLQLCNKPPKKGQKLASWSGAKSPRGSINGMFCKGRDFSKNTPFRGPTQRKEKIVNHLRFNCYSFKGNFYDSDSFALVPTASRLKASSPSIGMKKTSPFVLTPRTHDDCLNQVVPYDVLPSNMRVRVTV